MTIQLFLESEVGTYGLPEFGTKFVRQMLLETRPTTFAELVRISGLYVAKSIYDARSYGGFISKEDLRIRSKVSKSVLETLAHQGCLDGLPETNQLSLF